MARTDLIALTPESIAALTVVGFVKRAQREIAAGDGPSLDELDDGTVVGTFKDGVIAKLIPGKTFKDTPCTCGASAGCRHRVAVALSYRDWYEAKVTRSKRGPALDRSWTPAELEDCDLEKTVGKKVMDRARAVFKAGIVVTVVPPTDEDPVPTARLPACTVRFLVPRDIAYARCDCAIGTGCEHVVLAAWAFRQAGKLEADKTIALGKAQKTDGETHKALAQAEDLTAMLLRIGIANVTAGVQGRFAKVRAALEDEGLVWPMGVVDDLEQQLDAYAARSARYSTRQVLDLATELAARARAAKAGGELPARFILGEDEVKETLLDHVRLVSLGARVEADGKFRDAEVFLADPDTGVVLVLKKRWELGEKDKPEDGPALARRAVAQRLQLGALAHGQIVSKAVKRKANREMTLGTTRTAQTSVTPQRGDWDGLPVPLLVKNLSRIGEHMREAAPRLLRPRVLCEGMHVLAVGKLEEMGYLSAEQELWAVVTDAEGEQLRIRKRHKTVAPFSLEATAAALAKGVRFIAGEIERDHGGLVMDPVGLVTADGVVVPDLAASAPKLDVPRAQAHVHPDPMDDVLARATSVLEEGLHAGLDRASGETVRRLKETAALAESLGLSGLGTRLLRVAETAGKEAAPAAWMDAAIRTALTREIIA